MDKTLVLGHTTISKKLDRLAFELCERLFEKDFILVGIRDSGFQLAKELHSRLKNIMVENDLASKIEVGQMMLDKDEPLQHEVKLYSLPEDYSQFTIVLVDDVLYTGRTMFYSLKPFLEQPIQGLFTLVLVDREYRSFPVSADFTGYHLSTTLQDHVEVQLQEGNFAVYLS